MIGRLLLCLTLLTSPGLACEVTRRGSVSFENAGNLMLVPVEVNGQTGHFILDTGAALSVVTPAAVERFALERDEWTSTTLRGIGGVERRRNANPRSLTLAGVSLHRRSLARDQTLRVANLTIAAPDIDGLLGRDFLAAFDLELDPATRRLTLFSVMNCTGRFLPWPEDYTSVPVTAPAEDALWVPVHLDGVILRALLDTGANTSLIAAPGMARLGLDLDRLSHDPSRVASGLGPRTVTVWSHRFQTLGIAGQSWASPVLLVAPTALKPVSDMLLAADWVRRRKVWISYATRQLFLSGTQ